MSDEELEARLRRLAEDKPPDQDERFWVEMAAEVRAGYDATRQAARRPQRRRWVAPLAATLAMAAALALWLRVRPPAPLPADGSDDNVSMFDEPDTGEWIEEMTPAQLERVEKAFKKEGA